MKAKEAAGARGLRQLDAPPAIAAVVSVWAVGLPAVSARRARGGKAH
jgi:hypothetical protein